MARILIVEDETLIAMMLEEWIVELGHTPVGPAHSVAKAMELVRDAPCDAAIVDFNLRGETAEPVSALLRARNVPFAFASGDRMSGTDLQKVLPKPYAFEAVSQILSQLLGGKI